MYRIKRRSPKWLICFIMMPLLFIGYDAYSEEQPCHFELVTEEPEVQDAQILSPIIYRYKAIYDEHCKLNVMRRVHEAMNCSKPVIEIGPTERMSQLSARVSIMCHFLYTGYYYQVPVSFEISSKNEEISKTYYPMMKLVRIGGYQVAPEEKSLIQVLKLQEWKQNHRRMWLLFFTLGVIFLYILLIFYKGVVRTRIQSKREVSEKPIDIFLSEVAKLVDETPMSMEEYKTYHDRLSGAFRRFVSERYGFRGLNCTTTQFCEHLERLEISKDLCEETRRLLSESDCIKFAQELPSQATNLLLLRDTRYLASHLEEIMIRRENAIIEAQMNQDYEEQGNDLKS